MLVHDLFQSPEREYNTEIHWNLHELAGLLTDHLEQRGGMWAVDGDQSPWRLEQE